MEGNETKSNSAKLKLSLYTVEDEGGTQGDPICPNYEWSLAANQPHILCLIIKVPCHGGSLYFVLLWELEGVLFDQQECLC